MTHMQPSDFNRALASIGYSRAQDALDIVMSTMIFISVDPRRIFLKLESAPVHELLVGIF